jgi:Zn-dependent peptidase ImmA (M78 family)
MGKKTEALIKAELLIWARESARISIGEAARKLKIIPEKLEDWETGKSRPSMSQLRKLGELYQRPIAVFYLPEKPLDFKPLRDFRRIPDMLGYRDERKINFNIRSSAYKREIALRLSEELYGSVPDFQYKISLTEDPEEIGNYIRKVLMIGNDTQSSWKEEYEAFNAWRSAIENLGVLIFQCTDVDLYDMRGFSICEYPLPAICLNIKDSVRGRIFTLLHEFCHLMLHVGGICDIDEDFERYDDEQNMEIFCNHVAGAALIPKSALLNVIEGAAIDQWSDEELTILSKQFKTSKEVVLRRILICGLTSQQFYKVKRHEFEEEYKRLRKKKSTGFVPYYKKIIFRSGIPFIRLVLNGYHQEKITSRDLSDFLDVNLKHIPRIESATKMA